MNIKRVGVAILLLGMVFAGASLFQPARAISGKADFRVQILDSLGNVVNGTASAVVGKADYRVQILDSTGHIVDSFVGAATSLISPALNYIGSVGIVGNQGNGSDFIKNACVNGNCPVTAFGAVSAAAEPTAITATTDGVTPVVQLSGIGQFVNGGRIVMYGAGAACEISPCTSPSAPTGIVAGYTGGGGGPSTTYLYKYVVAGTNWSYTPASTVSANQVAAVTLTEPKETGSDNLGNNIAMTAASPTNTKHWIWWRSTDGGATWLLWRSWDTNTFTDWSNHQSGGTNTGPFTNTPPVAATNQLFTAKILSGGGTTTLTLDAIPPTAGAFTAFPDNTAAFQAAYDACTVSGGTIPIPPGIYKVRTVQPKPGCNLVGPQQLVTRANVIGTTGMDVFQWPPGTQASNAATGFYNLSITRGRSQIASMGSAASANNLAFVNLENLELSAADYAGIEWFNSSNEEWWVKNIKIDGGWYNWDMSNDGNATNYYIDKSDVSQLQLGGAFVNGLHFVLSHAGNSLLHTVFHRITVGSSYQDPLYIATPQRIMMWDEVSTEGTGIDSPKTYQTQTATCSSSINPNVYLVSSTTGLNLGDDMIVPNCGANGIPVHGTVCAKVTDTSFTLQDPSCTTPINASVSTTGTANTGWVDQILFAGALSSAPITNSDISATSGSEGGGIRYEVNSFNGLLQIQNSIIPLVYDPGATLQCFGCFNTTVYKPAITAQGFTAGVLSSAPASGGATNYSLMTSSLGGDIDTALLDTNNNGTGTYGQWRLRTPDGSRTTRLSVDNIGTIFTRSAFEGITNTATYGTTVTPDLSKGIQITITITDGVGWTLANPTNAFSIAPAYFKLFISNTSGGVGGAIGLGSQWRANVDGTFGLVAPANGKHRICDVEEHSGTLFYIGPCSGDIAN